MAFGLKDFDYELPRELVAPYPVPKRSEARLLVLDRASQKVEHRIFKDLPDYLRAGDLLVLNNTKVLPARLFGRKPTGGKVEVLLLKPLQKTLWEILLRPSGRIKKGTRLLFRDNGIRLEGEILDEPSGVSGMRKIQFDVTPHLSSPREAGGGRRGEEGIKEILNQIGRIPLPPYLDRPDEAIDRELYQTVFAQVEGAVASPTAGLHFDESLLETLREKRIEICFVTLHVSYGTFQPIRTEDLSQHEMYEETYEITEKGAEQIQRALKAKRRIIACGTSVVRVLETLAQGGPVRGKTRLFIRPPYKFKVLDALITNFHFPRTTLLMLVSAFAGRDLIFQVYQKAIRERYRFYSYGDAMLIL